MNSEAFSTICKLCKRRRHLQITRVYPRATQTILLWCIANSCSQKDGGRIRVIAIGTIIFHKPINSVAMCNIKNRLTGTLFLCSLEWAYQEVLREHSIWDQKHPGCNHPYWILVSLDFTNALNSVKRA